MAQLTDERAYIFGNAARFTDVGTKKVAVKRKYRRRTIVVGIGIRVPPKAKRKDGSKQIKPPRRQESRNLWFFRRKGGRNWLLQKEQFQWAAL